VLYALLKPFGVLLMRLLFRIRRHGHHHVPRHGPVLLVANHSSVLDPPLIAGMTPRPVAFLAKAELFDLPVFGRLIRRLGAHPLRREGGDPAALRAALRLLAEGRALLVFPEGTRGPEGQLRPPKPGAGMLAVLSRAPVIPVYISGTGRAWPRGRRWPRPARVTVRFGEPVCIPGPDREGRKDSYEAASRAMMAAIARLKDAEDQARSASPRELGAAIDGVGAGGASTPSNYT
jgi:1-acyl-sn-glycerol-3-phosphate acyltransferase